MGTYWTLRSLPGAPEAERRASLVVSVASFGVGQVPENMERLTDPVQRYHALVARLLRGPPGTPTTAWAVLAPPEVKRMRADLEDAWGKANKHMAADYGDWFHDEHLTMTRLLTHATVRNEWVVSVHEFDAVCFERGGTKEGGPGADPWTPPCKVPAKSAERGWAPFGLAGVLVVSAGLALLALRRRGA